MKEAEETSEQRFKRLAEVRTKQVLDKLRILGNCSNRQIYSYSREDIDKIFSVIDKQIKAVKSNFNHFKINEEFKL